MLGLLCSIFSKWSIYKKVSKEVLCSVHQINGEGKLQSLVKEGNDLRIWHLHFFHTSLHVTKGNLKGIKSLVSCWLFDSWCKIKLSNWLRSPLDTGTQPEITTTAGTSRNLSSSFLPARLRPGQPSTGLLWAAVLLTTLMGQQEASDALVLLLQGGLS